MSDCADNFGTEKSAPEEKATTVNPDIGTEVASKSPETKFDSSVSDHVVDKPKPLESEPELRNTSTSNAGESEYESANEEDLEFFASKSEADSKTIVSNVVAEVCEKVAPSTNVTNEPSADLNELQIEDKRNDSNISTSESKNVGDSINQNAVASNQNIVDSKSLTANELDSDSGESKQQAMEELAADEEISIDSETSEPITDVSKEDPDDLKVDFEGEPDLDDDEELANQEARLKANQLGAKATATAKKSEVEDKRNPQYIPRKGPFYEHDDRINEDDEVDDEAQNQPKTTGEVDSNQNESVKLKPKKKPMKLRSDEMLEEEGDTEKPSRATRNSISSEKSEVEPNNLTDVKLNDNVFQNEQTDSKPGREWRKKPIWDSGDRWSHDKFNPDDQQPKTREELILAYGYDIRGEEDAPKLQRRSKYGKGPQKYSRRSEDETAYMKRSQRKVNKFSGQNRPTTDTDSRATNRREAQKNTAARQTSIPEESDPSRGRDFRSRRTPPRDSHKPHKYSESSSNRIHENGRVFTNKSSKFAKSTDRQPKVKTEGHKPSEVPKRDVPSNVDSGLFNTEDFPELAPKKNGPQKADGGKVIFYSNNETKSSNTPQTESFADSDGAKEKSSVPVVTSQMFENSRYSRNRAQEYAGTWNNSSSTRNSKPQYSQNRKQPVGNNKEEESANLSSGELNEDGSRPKRYSSIRQQRNNSARSNSPQQQQQSNNFNQVTSNQQPFSEDSPKSLPIDSGKNAYYDSSTPEVGGNLGHHASYNGTTTAGPTPPAPAQAAAAAFIPNPNLVYYDHSNAGAGGQTASSTSAPIPATISLPPQAYFADQAGAAQAVQNYYLTAADLQAAVAFNPAAAAYMQANYPQQLPSHHTHQSHVANRYLNTTPSNSTASDSSRYLQTGSSSQSSAPLIVAGTVPNMPGQAYQPTMQTAFPSGYPQFPPPAPASSSTVGTSSPLPAGYPNVPLGVSNTVTTPTSNTQQATASGYPELYRGGITYYDIQSQQQAMHRHFHPSIPPQQPPRRGKNNPHPNSSSADPKQPQQEISDSGDTNGEMSTAKPEVTHKQPSNEISVNN